MGDDSLCREVMVSLHTSRSYGSCKFSILSSMMFPEFYVYGLCCSVSCRAGYPTVGCSLHFDQLWLSVVVSASYKKVISCEMRATTDLWV